MWYLQWLNAREQTEHLNDLHQSNQCFWSGQRRHFITSLSGVCNTQPIKDCGLLSMVNETLYAYRLKSIPSKLFTAAWLLIKTLRGLRAHTWISWGVCNTVLIHTRTIKEDYSAPMCTSTMPPLLSNSAERSFFFFFFYMKFITSPLAAHPSMLLFVCCNLWIPQNC